MFSWISWIDLIFIYFTLTIVVFAIGINISESNISPVLLQTFRYGKHAYKGKPSRVVQAFEVPKSYFKHFYVFAIVWAILIFGLTFNLYVLGTAVPGFVIDALDFLYGKDRSVTMSAFTALQATFLLTLQCARRFYETQYIQVFSKQAKINFTHYLVGYLHYFGAFLAIISRAPGFVRNPNPEDLTYIHIDMIVPRNLSMMTVFFLAWFQQLRTNLILANLRKNRSGDVVTEKHLMPQGGFFDFVSSPHMLWEIVMYTALTVTLLPNLSWIWVFLWVVSNQIENAWLTHKWYLETFKNYPTERRAIIPGIL